MYTKNEIIGILLNKFNNSTIMDHEDGVELLKAKSKNSSKTSQLSVLPGNSLAKC